MKSRIITVLTTAVLSASMLISCNSEQNRQANLDGRSQDPADTAKIDPNTGLLTTSNYYVSDNSSIMRGSMPSDYIAARPAPNNDPQLMENPSAVKNASRDNQRQNTATYVDSENGYVDKPGSGNREIDTSNTQIAVNTDNKQTAENEEESKNNANLSQKNHDLIQQYKKELSSINNKIEGNFNDRQYQQRKPLAPKGEAKGVVTKELAGFDARREQLEQQISKLETDNKNNYQLTKNLIVKNQLAKSTKTAGNVNINGQVNNKNVSSNSMKGNAIQ